MRVLTHPMTAAVVITALAVGLGAAEVLAATPHPLLWPALLTVSGVATGFANSGST